MGDIVTAASEKTSSEAARSDHVLERLEALAEQYDDECKPKPWIYIITDAEEASQILLAMAAVIKITSKDVRNAMDKATYLEVAADYRKAVVRGEALQTFRNMTEEDQLELYGLTLTVPRIKLS